jgi:hypothetical protein
MPDAPGQCFRSASEAFPKRFFSPGAFFASAKRQIPPAGKTENREGCELVNDRFSIFVGSTSRRQRFPML